MEFRIAGRVIICNLPAV